MIRLVLAAVLLAAGSPAFSQITRSAPPEVDDELRTRVAAFYSHFQKGEFREAEKYIDEASKDVFYGAKKNRIINFEIRTVKYAEDFRSANVLVACETMVPLLGSKPLAVPLASDWQYGEDGWLMHLKDPGDERAKVATAGSPFGQMQFSQELPEPGQLSVQQQQVQPPTVDSLAGMYHVSTTNIRFVSTTGPSSRVVRVENKAAGKLSVEVSSSPVRGITLEFDKKDIEPGETANLTITYNPEENQLKGRRRVDLLLMPISQTVPLFLDF